MLLGVNGPRKRDLMVLLDKLLDAIQASLLDF